MQISWVEFSNNNKSLGSVFVMLNSPYNNNFSSFMKSCTKNMLDGYIKKFYSIPEML